MGGCRVDRCWLRVALRLDRDSALWRSHERWLCEDGWLRHWLLHLWLLSGWILTWLMNSGVKIGIALLVPPHHRHQDKEGYVSGVSSDEAVPDHDEEDEAWMTLNWEDEQVHDREQHVSDQVEHTDDDREVHLLPWHLDLFAPFTHDLAAEEDEES